MPSLSAGRFLAAVSGRNSPWQSIDLRILAVRIGRRWTNLLTRGYLVHLPDTQVPRLRQVDRCNLACWQVVLPIKSLGSVLTGMESGFFSRRPRAVAYRSNSDDSAPILDYRFQELSGAYPTLDHEWSCHALISYYSSMWDLIREAGIDPLDIDNLLRAGANPHDGIADLAASFHQRRGSLGLQGSTAILELLAPVGIKLDQSRTAVSDKAVSVVMRALSSVYARGATLNWRIIDSGNRSRAGSLRLARKTWTRSKSDVTTTVSVPLKTDDIALQLSLTVGDRCVDRARIPLAASNPRIAAHATFDPDLKEFERDLFPEDWSKGSNFERSVCLLMHFLGFQTDPLFGARRKDAVDHMAHDSDTSTVLAIECTCGPLDAAGKLGKLLARTTRIDASIAGQTIPVLVTARPAAELSPTELQKAEDDGILVLSREDLIELLAAAKLGMSSTEVVQRLTAKRLALAAEGHKLPR